MKLKNLDLKRLILIDLDGTTLKSDGKTMHSETKKALLDAQKDGHLVCIMTGRPVRAILQTYQELKLSTLVVNVDGAHISDPSKREFKRIIFSINNEIILQIINEPIIKKSVENIMFEYYNKVLIWKKDEEFNAFFHLSNIKNDENEQLIVGDPWTKWEGPSTNIVLKLSDQKYKNQVIRTLAKYSDAIKIQSDVLYGVASQSEKPVFTLVNKIASKGFAMNFLAQYYNKDIRDIIAFGDQLNDFELLEKAGIGIAMKNGAEPLKFIANGITHKTNDQGGLGDYLTKILAGEDY